jgi:hypothetical protein
MHGNKEEAALMEKPLLAVAEALGMNREDDKISKWRVLIEQLNEWLRLVSGDWGRPSDAYDPLQTDISGFAVAAASTPRLELPGMGVEGRDDILYTLKRWGLRRHLTMDHVLQEALSIQSMEADEPKEALACGGTLCSYLTSNNAYFEEQAKDHAGAGIRELLLAVRCVPCRPATALGPDAVLGTSVPAAMECLHTPRALLAPKHVGVVWTAQPTALVPQGSFVGCKSLDANDVACHMEALSRYLKRDAKESDVHGALHHLRTVALWLASNLDQSSSQISAAVLKQLDKGGTAWVPCHITEGWGRSVVLLQPSKVAQSGQDLSPALGSLHDSFRQSLQLLRLLNKAGVVEEFDGKILTFCLAELKSEPRLSPEQLDLAARLATALAKCLGNILPRKRERYLAELGDVFVPTENKKLVISGTVHIDDAPWTQSRHLQILSTSIASKFGRLLGCKSVRDQLAAECEGDDDQVFGQQEDLVDRIKQLCAEYHGNEDLFREFFQNTDDHGSPALHFVVDTNTYPDDQLVDTRAKGLQGPALLVCSTKELSPEDIRRMQQLGRSAKRGDFTTAGRFGVGMNSMYQISDCVQLYANGMLHFFDPMQKFVARPERTESGRLFGLSKLDKDFPNMLAPFRGVRGEYCVVFRLPLRTAFSEFGAAVSATDLERRVRCFSSSADQLLLFSRNISAVKSSLHSAGMPRKGIAAHTLSCAVSGEVQQDAKARVAGLLPSNLKDLFPATARRSSPCNSQLLFDVKITSLSGMLLGGTLAGLCSYDACTDTGT